MDVLLNRVFTTRELNALVNTGKTKYAQKASKKYGLSSQSMVDALKSVYAFLGSHHRNEYYYKNQLLNKIVFGKHSPNTTSALRELPVSNSIADFIIINGCAQVYEIKTELDTLQRLNGQLKNYYKAFKFVNVITDEKYVVEIEKRVDSDIGIYTLTRKNQIHCVRKATEHSDELDSRTMFKIFRKYEFEHVNKKYFGELPKVGASKYYEANFDIFKTLPIDNQQRELTRVLKNRYLNRFKGKVSLIEACPKELKELVYFSNLKDKQIKKINRLFNTGNEV